MKLLENINLGKKTLFLVGAPRSGTTWLQLILSQSPKIASWQETHLFSMYLRSMFSSWTHFVNQNRDRGLSSLLTEEEFLQSVREFCVKPLSRIALDQPYANVILEKTPNHGLLGPIILRIFPEAWFIHIIRDPRAVVNSLLSASKAWGSSWAPGTLTDASGMWKRDVAQAQSISSLTGNYKELRYEKLHLEPVDEIGSIFSWLGEECEREHVPRYVSACNIDKLRSSEVSAPWDLKTEPPQFFRRGEVDSWREELSGPEIAIVERLTRKHMARLGYEPIASRRDRVIAKARLKTYRLAERLAAAARAGADRIKP